jgi:hypothetical protein
MLALVAGTTREETTMAVQELPREQKQLIEGLARFRNGLEPLERQILDTVVRQACEPNGPQAAQPAAGAAPTEDEVARLVEKIEGFEETLPDDRRRLLDEVLSSGSHNEADVEAHGLLWSRWGGLGPVFWAVYGVECSNDGGSYLEFNPDYWHYFGTAGWYKCWKW